LGPEDEVRRKVERLIRAEEEGGYEAMAGEACSKRLSWYRRNAKRLRLAGTDVRRAYSLLLIQYLGLDPRDVPVIYEDEKRIVWRSYNFCPLLEACNRLGLDTKMVCRSQEAAAQTLVSKVNPNLRFTRNYDSLRPRSPYCEEMIYEP